MICLNGSCGAELQPHWIVCPYCQQPATSPSNPGQDVSLTDNVMKDTTVSIDFDKQGPMNPNNSSTVQRSGINISGNVAKGSNINLSSGGNRQVENPNLTGSTSPDSFDKNVDQSGGLDVNLEGNVFNKSNVNIDQSRHTNILDNSQHHTNIYENGAAKAEQAFRVRVDNVLREHGPQQLRHNSAQLDQIGRGLGVTASDCARIRLELLEAYQGDQTHRKQVENRRNKYRIRVGDSIVHEDILNAQAVVHFLNRNSNSAHAFYVDLDQSKEWLPAVSIDEIWNHSDISFKCIKTGTALDRSQAVMCNSCHRVFRKDLVNDNKLCSDCSRQSFANISSVVSPLPVDKTASLLLDPTMWRAVPKGSFEMGSPGDESGRDDDERLHSVEIGCDLSVLVTPVTEELYGRVMGTGDGRGDYPVVDVKWYDAIKFCNQFSSELGVPEAYSIEGGSLVQWLRVSEGIRLLTEAEWEYVCRAGSQGLYYQGDRSSLHEIAVYQSHAIEPLKVRQANLFGLHDTLGTVWEWVWDAKADYPSAATKDPTNESIGLFKCVRGGCFSETADHCRCAKRYFVMATRKSPLTGFRICRTLKSNRNR